MKTKKDYLIDAVINGNNSFDIDKDLKITEDVLNAMQKYADSNLNNAETAQLGIGTVSSSTDFWIDAQDFLKSQLPKDFEDNLKKYITYKGYNQNEFRLFKNMLQEAVGFHGTIVLLKHYC